MKWWSLSRWLQPAGWYDLFDVREKTAAQERDMSARRCAIRHRPGRKNPAGFFLCPEHFKRRARARRRSNPPPAGGSQSDKLQHSTVGEAVLLYFEAARATLGPDEPQFSLELSIALCLSGRIERFRFARSRSRQIVDEPQFLVDGLCKHFGQEVQQSDRTIHLVQCDAKLFICFHHRVEI